MRRIVLIQPKRDGRIFGKSPGSPYTLMRLASLVPAEIPVEIWDENVRRLPLDTLREGDLVGITSMTVTIEGAEVIARRAMKQGAGVVVGGVHATLLPEHTSTFAHSVMVGEGYFTWQQLVQDFAAAGIKGMQEFWLRLDMSTQAAASPLRIRGLHICVGYQQNMHLQPRLVPGENELYVQADKLDGMKLVTQWTYTHPEGDRVECVELCKPGREVRKVNPGIAKPDGLIMRGVTLKCLPAN